MFMLRLMERYMMLLKGSWRCFMIVIIRVRRLTIIKIRKIKTIISIMIIKNSYTKSSTK